MPKARLAIALLALTLLGGCAVTGERAQQTVVAELHQLFDDEWERRLRENPTFASMLGDLRYNDRWPELTPQAIERRRQAERDALQRLLAIDRNALPPPEQLNYDLFRRGYESSIQGQAWPSERIAINQRGGIQTADNLARQLRFARERDYEDWIARLEAFDVYMDQTIVLLREGVESGWTLPRVIAERIPAQIESQRVDDPEDSGFYTPLRSMPERIAPETQVALRERALAAVRDVVLPAYARFHEFFTTEYLPGARNSIAARDFPDGQAYYAWRARDFTTTDLSPQQIHDTGLSEVARIRAEMQKVIERTGFEGGFDAFLEYLRTDPKFYFDDPQDLLTAYEAASKRVDPVLPRFFGRLPRMPYGVQPIPDNIAPDTTTAYYQRPSADGTRAGYYFVNLYKPETRPKYEIEALTIHEAVPGHHFQIALAMELEDIPAFRRFSGPTAFVEGWALYTEWLGAEMGFYQDPYSKFGQLTYEMWRAVRLVVDTGIHELGWSRERAIEFFKANAAKSEHDIVNEIDRYIAWPGQALAYKIGELKIRELRARAEQALGEAFDLRAFHDRVLENGAIPLDVLERVIDRWIEEQAA